MSNILLVQAPINITYSEVETHFEDYEREFNQMSESDDDPIGQWLKTSKARGDTSESDPIVLSLLVELHRKIDRLEQVLTNSIVERNFLTHNALIESIGFEHFKLKDHELEVGKNYYGRIEMPIHPKREIALFFEAVEGTLAKITRINERDEREWGAYVTARERVMIRQLKGRE